MPLDLIAEQTLVDLSRVQRASLERWFGILLMAGETAIAEEIRRFGSLDRIEAQERELVQ